MQRIKLSRPSTDMITVSYEVVEARAPFLPGSATSGVDFAAASGTVVFAPGQTEAGIPITIYGDTDYESGEELIVRIISATGATPDPYGEFGRTSRYISIDNDDPSPGSAAGDEPVIDPANV